MRRELLFLSFIFSLIWIVSSIDTVEIAPQIGTVIPVNGLINASESQSQISMIDANISSLTFSLNWENMDSDLEMSLESPSGEQINQSAQTPIIYKKEKIDIYYIIPNPEPGNWTAIIEAKKVPSEGEKYVFFAAQVLGIETIAENSTESEELTSTVNETEST
jgi:hypothetical protein